MSWALRFYNSSIGMKVVMAVTGVMMFGFVIAHMLGNLQVFWGPEILNKYAEFLHEHPTFLWVLRFGLIGAVLAHIHAAWTLTMRSRAARPSGYKKTARGSYAHIGMRTSAFFLLAFIVYHLLHMTFGVVHHDFQHHEVFHNLVLGFQVKPVAGHRSTSSRNVAFWGMHLYHGLWSMLQTLGVSNHPRYDALEPEYGAGRLRRVVGGRHHGFIAGNPARYRPW